MLEKFFNNRKASLFEHLSHDAFFDKLSHDLIDYGCDVRFSAFGGAGAYKPFALSTERLDNPDKQAQFSQGFLTMTMSGALKAIITLHLFSSTARQTHSLMHEMMHFYQDTLGLYFLPLQEKGVFPVMPDARSMMRVVLFNEAWAEVEAIRAAWAMNRQGHKVAWQGALKSKDWSALAQSYDADLQSGVDEAKAAANLITRWYEGGHRTFYEGHGLSVFDAHMAQFKGGLAQGECDEAHLRCVHVPDIIARIPESEVPSYFHQVDWDLPLFNIIQSPAVKGRFAQKSYFVSDDRAVGDIRHGAPPYLWRQLRVQEVTTADIPAQMLKSDND